MTEFNKRKKIMEKTKAISPPTIGKYPNVDFEAALDEKKYLETYAQPPYGWVTSIQAQIENRLTLLNKIIADKILERKTENGN
jgi:hypothetical protein